MDPRFDITDEIKDNDNILLETSDKSSKNNPSRRSNFSIVKHTLFCFYNDLLDVQIFTPLLYAIVLVVSALQFLYFVLMEVQVYVEHSQMSYFAFKIFLSYIAAAPAIIDAQIGRLFNAVFLILVCLIFLFFTLLVVYHLKIRETKLSKTYGLKKQISGTSKIILKVASGFLIIHKELLVIPSILLTLNLLKCDTQYNEDSGQDSSMHLASGAVCWSSQYTIFFALAIAHILLLVVFQILQHIFLNDYYPECKLPWATPLQKPRTLEFLMVLTYCLWHEVDLSKDFKIVADVIATIMASTTLFLRLRVPLFHSELIKKVTVAIDVTKMTLLFVVITLKIFNSQLNVMSICLALVSTVCFVGYWLQTMGHILNKRFNNGFSHIKNDIQLTLFLSKAIKLISKDQKKHQIQLQGMLQAHIFTCNQIECPCMTLADGFMFKRPGQSVSGGAQASENSNIGTRRTSLLLQKNHQSSKLTKEQIAQHQFMEKYQSIKSSNRQSTFKKFFFGHQQEIAEDTGVQKNNLSLKSWYSFISFQLKQIAPKIKLTVFFHFMDATFYFLRMQNEFKALFELQVAEEKKPKLFDQFVIFRLNKRIEKLMLAKHEKQTSLGRKINILSVYDYERNASIFQKLILKSTLFSITFWSELLEKQINVEKMHELGIQISNNHQIITKIASQLQQVYSSQLTMLMIYSRYLNDIINNEYNAIDVYSKALLEHNILSSRQHIISSENEEQMFGENSFCCIIVISTDYQDMGIIEYANEEVMNLMGYQPRELIGKDINSIIPKEIARVHTKLMVRFFEKAESSILNKIRELFVQDKDGYFVPIYLFAKLIPNLEHGLKLIGQIKKIDNLTLDPQCPADFSKMPQDYILCNSYNNIQNFSYGITQDFGLFPKMFIGQNQNSLFAQDINIEYLSHEFADKHEDLNSTGALITIDTQRLLEKVDREVLTNEEFTYFMNKTVPTKVFCQLIELRYGGLVALKLYRIIQVLKHSEQVPKTNYSAVKEMSADEHKVQDINLGSVSQSSTSHSTAYSLDRQLKDFKKKITDNTEPREISIIKRVVVIFSMLLIIGAAVIFYNNQISYQLTQGYLDKALSNVFRQNLLVSLLLNIRSMVNVANKLEPFQFNENVPYEDRFSYLSNTCFKQIEELRLLNNNLATNNRSEISLTELDARGKTYQYETNFNLAMELVVTRALDLVNRTQSELLSKVTSVHQSESPQQGKFDNSIVESSTFYIVYNGFKSLLKISQQKMLHSLDELDSFKLKSLNIVQWLVIIFCLIIVSFKLVFLYIISNIESNKAQVLGLYSEIRIVDVKVSLEKCKVFLKKLMSQDTDMIEDSMDSFYMSQHMSANSQRGREFQDFDFDDFMFVASWNKLNGRINGLRVNPQRQNIKRLTRRMNENRLEKVKNLKEERKLSYSNGRGASPLQNTQLPQWNKIGPFDKTQGEQQPQKQQPETPKRDRHQKKRVSAINASEVEVEYIDSQSVSSEFVEVPQKEINVQQIKPVEDSDDAKIGKSELFLKIKKKNWQHAIMILIKTMITLFFFLFSFLYPESIVSQVRTTNVDLRISFNRQTNMNTLYGYFRERILFNDSSFIPWEQESYENFYFLEQKIQDLTLAHNSFTNFAYDFLIKVDSAEFCSILESLINETQCRSFKQGIFRQGYQSAYYTFISYYTQANTTLLMTLNSTQQLEALNNDNLQSYFIAQETYLSEATKALEVLWRENSNDYFENAQNITRVMFIIFLFCYLAMTFTLIPYIFRQLNEATWRSRGILNLVPNEIFRQMNQNSKIFKMLKN